jgi:plastocyanin
VANRYESVARRSDTIIATLYASRRITDATDLFASYTFWQTDGVRHPQMEIGIRQRFDELPTFVRGTISGRVTPVIAPVEIELDGEQRVQAARDGSFSFAHVKSGSHRVVARLTGASETYFTTPSRVEANAGDVVTFGLASSPGHLFGRVVSDAGDGIGGIGVALTRGATHLEATSATDGSFTLNAAPGEWELTLDAFSLPPGFTLEGASKNVMLETAQPSNITFTARANRSIHGRAPAGVKSIAVEPLGMQVPVGADGAFTIRSLPAGALTLRGGAHTTKVTMPREPATMKVNF